MENTITQYSVKYTEYAVIDGKMQTEVHTKVIKGVGVWTNSERIANRIKDDINNMSHRDSSLNSWIETRQR